MSVESEQFSAKVADVVREKDQIIALVTTQQTNIAALGQQIADLIASNASEKELADAARAALPVLTQAVNDMDVFTPEGTPVIEA